MAGIDVDDMDRECFAQLMAARGVFPCDLRAALHAARQLGQGLFLCLVERGSSSNGSNKEVGSKSQHGKLLLPAADPRWTWARTGASRAVAKHLPRAVREELLLLRRTSGKPLPRSALTSARGTSSCLAGGAPEHHTAFECERLCARLQAWWRTAQATVREAAEWYLAIHGVPLPSKPQALVDAYDALANAIVASINAYNESPQARFEDALCQWGAPSQLHRMAGGPAADAEDSFAVELQRKFGLEVAALRLHFTEGEQMAAAQKYQEFAARRQSAFESYMQQTGAVRPPCPQCLRACNGLCNRRLAEAQLPVTAAAAGHLAPPPNTEAVDAEVAAANVSAKLQKQAAKRGHKGVQAQLPTVKAESNEVAQAGQPLSAPMPAPMAGDKSAATKRASRVKTARPSPQQLDAERSMQKVRAFVQEHLTTAPPLVEEGRVAKKERRMRRRANRQGDKLLAKRMQTNELL
eukprot:symbB.v1.2.030815.t1/scaffold3513.1/size55048/5